MTIFPDQDRSFVRICDERVPGQEWLLRLPEYGYGRAPLSGVKWEVREEGKKLYYTWSPPPETRSQIGIAYESEIEARADEVEFSIARRNLSESSWKDREVGSLFCFMSRDASLFHDIDGVRSYALKDDIFQSVNQLVNSRFMHHRMCSFPVRTSPEGPKENACERLMAKISRDAEWVVGIATNIAGWISCNQQPQVSCIHSNPWWGAVPPGGEAKARGKVYLVESIDVLKARYVADFGGLKD